jgi:hypothetical protein
MSSQAMGTATALIPGLRKTGVIPGGSGVIPNDSVVIPSECEESHPCGLSEISPPPRRDRNEISSIALRSAMEIDND